MICYVTQLCAGSASNREAFLVQRTTGMHTLTNKGNFQVSRIFCGAVINTLLVNWNHLVQLSWCSAWGPWGDGILYMVIYWWMKTQYRCRWCPAHIRQDASTKETWRNLLESSSLTQPWKLRLTSWHPSVVNVVSTFLQAQSCVLL